MADLFAVDLDVLTQFTSSLNRAGEEMRSALSAMSSHADPQIGPSELNGAANHFQSTWQYGLKQLDATIGDTSDGVSKVRAAYAQADESVTAALTSMSGGSDPGVFGEGP
jgi:uncharacterized protein YukE